MSELGSLKKCIAQFLRQGNESEAIFYLVSKTKVFIPAPWAIYYSGKTCTVIIILITEWIKQGRKGIFSGCSNISVILLIQRLDMHMTSLCPHRLIYKSQVEQGFKVWLEVLLPCFTSWFILKPLVPCPSPIYPMYNYFLIFFYYKEKKSFLITLSSDREKAFNRIYRP